MKRVEDPRRLKEFRVATANLSWAPDQAQSSLAQLFAALNVLAEAEVAYYYRRRDRSRWVSLSLRGLAWLLGTIGALIPLIAATLPEELKDLAPWGYVSLAAAASIFAANSLFGGSSGHVRYVTAQLNLEQLITRFRVDWYALNASLQDAAVDHKQVEKAFEIIARFVDSFYQVMLAETGSWGEVLMAELEKYRQSIKEGAQAGREVDAKQGPSRRAPNPGLAADA